MTIHLIPIVTYISWFSDFAHNQSFIDIARYAVMLELLLGNNDINFANYDFMMS